MKMSEHQKPIDEHPDEEENGRWWRGWPGIFRKHRKFTISAVIVAIAIVLVATSFYLASLGNQYSVSVISDQGAYNNGETAIISGSATLNGNLGTGTVELTVDCGDEDHEQTIYPTLSDGTYSASNSDFEFAITGTDGTCSMTATYGDATAYGWYAVYTAGEGGQETEPESDAR